MNLARVKNPSLVLASSFALGILAAHGGLHRLPWLLLPACASLLAGAVALRFSRPLLAAGFVAAGFVCAGGAARVLFDHRFAPSEVGNLARQGVDLSSPVVLQGEVQSELLHTGASSQFDLQANTLEAGSVRRSVSGFVRVHNSVPWIHLNAHSLQPGDRIRLRLRLYPPRPNLNPGGFNYAWWLQTVEDINMEGAITAPPAILGHKKASLLNPRLLALYVRRRLRHGIEVLFPPWSPAGSDGAVLKAVLLGDRSALDSATIDAFRESGLYHLLVVAGLHVGLLVMLLGVLLRWLRIPRRGHGAILLTFLVCYAMVAEQRAPTLRAALMIGIYLLGDMLFREHRPLNAVGIAALLLLVDRPLWLFETGFELSFAAALLIAGLAVPILKRTTQPYLRALKRLDDLRVDMTTEPRLASFRLQVREVMQWAGERWIIFDAHPRLVSGFILGVVKLTLVIASALIFSTILQAGLLLLMVLDFHRVAVGGIGLNAVAIPMMALLLGAAAPVVLLAAFVPNLLLWTAAPISVLIHAILWLTSLARLSPWLSFRVADPPHWLAWGFATAFLVAGFCAERRRAALLLSLAAAGLASLLIAINPFAARLRQGALELTALDCGGGEAILVVFPDRTTLLAGACGRTRAHTRHSGGFRYHTWDPGESLVSPYLWSRGVRSINVLLAPAGGSALDGLESVVKNFQVQEFWLPPGAEFQPGTGLSHALRRANTRIRRIQSGDRFTRPCCTIEFPEGAQRLPAPREALRQGLPLLRFQAGPEAFLVAAGDSERAVAGYAAAPGFSPAPGLVIWKQEVDDQQAAAIIKALRPGIALIDSAAVRSLGDDPDWAALPASLPNLVTAFTAREGASTLLWNGRQLCLQAMTSRRARCVAE